MANEFTVPVYVFSKDGVRIYEGVAHVNTPESGRISFNDDLTNRFGDYFLYTATNGGNVLSACQLWENPINGNVDDNTLNDYLDRR